ncbi:MAG: ABC transporter substrate-binding protein [Deltaproteobacteria bacterium]|nr:ABC transporter substrate-binding protein [Deltaproteobacteria bacterium]
MKRSHWLPWVGWLQVLILAAALAGCQDSKPQMLRVGGTIWPGYEGIYLANHLGYYQGLPIRVIEYPSASAAIRDFQEGLLEAIPLTMDETLLQSGGGVPFKVVMVFDVSHGGDVIIARKGIRRFSQLKGKKIALESNALGAYMLSRALEINRLGPSDIIPVNRDLNEQENALIQGEVDAVVTFGPVSAKLLAKGYSKVFDSRQIPGEIVDVLLVRTDYLERNPKMVASLISGYFKALDMQSNQFTIAAEFSARREGVTMEEFQQGLEGIHILTPQENLRWFGEEREDFLRRTEKLAQVMAKNKLLQQKVDGASLLDGKILGMVNVP